MHSSPYLNSMARFVGLPPESLTASGTTIVPVESRTGKRVVSQYHIGDHSLLLIDPNLTGAVQHFASDLETLDSAQFREWADDQGAQYHGQGSEFVLGQLPAPHQDPELVTLDGTLQATKNLVTALHSGCTSSDVDEAEFEIEDLDPTLVGLIDHGALTALAGARPWDARPGLHDIGVIVHPDHRGEGAGTRVVEGVVQLLLNKGVTPLYRCSDANLGSASIARNTGFVRNGRVQAVTLPESGSDNGEK